MTLAQLLSNYPILQSFTSSLATLDLYHLGLTCKTIHSFILSSETKFNVLRRNCLCDGHGLAYRQAFTGLYSLKRRGYHWGRERHIWQDEPIEVRVYGTKCDECNSLPCCKCGVNVCEECRFYPREPQEYPERRPHLNQDWASHNVMCLCRKCDPILEEELRGRFLNELCDCDIYTRWICSKCVKDEREFWSEYSKNHTVCNGMGGTKTMGDHQADRDVCYSSELQALNLLTIASIIALVAA